MRFPYQDGPKKKKARSPPPTANSPAGSPELVLRNPSPSEDGKEREGKRRATQTAPTTVTQHSQVSVKFLNIVVAILVASVGLLLANKLF
jgi:hypothetical protein